MWGAIIGAGLNVAGSIYGGIKASKAAKESEAKIAEQRKKNQEWYNRRFNEDATQRGDAQRMLTRTEEMIRQRNKSTAGAQAVMGGTSDSVAAAKAANNQAISDAASTIAANAEARKDAIEATYLQNDAALNQQQAQVDQNRADATAQAVQGLFNTGASIAESSFNVNKDSEIPGNEKGDSDDDNN